MANVVNLCTVTLDANGGVIEGETTSSNFDPIHIASGQTLGDLLPTNLTKNGIPLTKWTDDDNNTITKDTPIENSVNLKAQYILLTPIVELNSLTKSDNTIYNAGEWSDKDINLVYNISSSTSTINPDKYKISIDGGITFTDILSSNLLQINQLDTSSNNSHFLSFSILQNGEYNIIIEAFDAENRSGQSEPISVKLDKIKPDPATITSSEYSNSDTPTIYGKGEIGCTIKVTDENNNIIGTAIVDENGEWEISEPLSNGQHTISIVQTNLAGNTSESTSQILIVDTTNPTGTITIKNNSFNTFLNTITFGLLFNDTTNVTITADDTPSGVKEIKYLKTDQVYSIFSDDLQNANWHNADISNENSVSFNVDVPQELFNDEFFVYAKITDNANNVTYLRSDGVILYTDSAITTDELTYTKPQEENKDLSVILNGNTIANIVNTTNTQTLTENVDYTVEDSKVILKHEYLNTLSENTYNLEISFTPAGETNITEGLTLPKDSVILYVEKSTQELPPEDAKFNNLFSSYTYGDIPETISLNGGSGTGEVTYSSSDEDVATIDQNGQLTIVGAGTFQITATKAADENYNELQVTSDVITVNKRPVTISGIVANSRPYNGYASAEFDITSAQIQNLVNNDQLSIVPGNASFADKNTGTNKEVYFSDFAILDSSGNTPKNYVLESQPENGSANIASLEVTITGVTAYNKVYDGTINATPNISQASINGKCDGDNLEISAGSAKFTNKNFGNNKTVVFSEFGLSGNNASNYLLTAQPENANANISKKSLTISNIKIKDKTLDGTRTAEFEGTPTLEGLADGDDVILINGTPIFTTSAEGQNIAIEFNPPFSLEGADALNYYVTQPTNIYGNITHPSDYQTDDISENLNNNQPKDETTPSDTSEINNNDSEEAFEAEDSLTGIRVSAPKGVFPRWCRLIIREMYPDTTEYTDNYKNLDEEKRSKIEHAKLYEIYIINQDGQTVQPDISKGLVTVDIPVPNDYDLTDLQIYRIKEDADDDFDEKVVNINNRSYCQFETDHFSPYTMIDENTLYDIIQQILPYLLLLLILLFSILLIIILLKRKKDKDEEEEVKQ